MTFFPETDEWEKSSSGHGASDEVSVICDGSTVFPYSPDLTAFKIIYSHNIGNKTWGQGSSPTIPEVGCRGQRCHTECVNGEMPDCTARRIFSSM